MIRPRQVRLKLNKSQFHHCQKLSQESAKVWNSVKNFFWRTDPSQAQDKKGIWLSEVSMKRYLSCTFFCALDSAMLKLEFKPWRAQGTNNSSKHQLIESVDEHKAHKNGRFSLHSQSVQAIIEKFYDNLKSARSLRKDNPDIRYPHKNKGWFCVHWKKSAIQVSGRYIHFSNGKGRQGIIFRLPKYLSDCQPRTVELIWRNGYWLSITLDIPSDKEQVLGFTTAAVDMGEIHAMTITDGKEALVISGRALRSVKRNRNKRVAQISRLQSRCKKNSRRFKRLHKVKSKVIAECHRRTKDLNHKITRIAVDWCIEHNIEKLIVGDVTGISQNTNNEKRLNRKNRQKISQWEFYKQRQYIGYKCQEIGIEIVLESENGTSKTCPKCEFTNAKGLWGISTNQQDEITIVQPAI